MYSFFCNLFLFSSIQKVKQFDGFNRFIFISVFFTLYKLHFNRSFFVLIINIYNYLYKLIPPILQVSFIIDL